MSDLDKIEKRIADLRQELTDLETAHRVIVELSNGDVQSEMGLVGKKTSKKRAVRVKGRRKNILVFAQNVLRKEPGLTLHYREIAEESMKKGYKSNRPGSTTEKVHHSFWTTMNRNEEIFQAVGKGRFKLK